MDFNLVTITELKAYIFESWYFMYSEVIFLYGRKGRTEKPQFNGLGTNGPISDVWWDYGLADIVRNSRHSPDESRTFSRPEHSIAAGVAILRPRPLVPRGSARLFFVYTRCRHRPASTHVELIIYAFL